MTGENYAEHPTGRTVSRGEPSIKLEKKVTSAVKAGHLVCISTTDYGIKPDDGSTPALGWVSYEDTDIRYRPDSLAAAYNVGDIAGVVAGGNFALLAYITGPTTGDDPLVIVPGDLLESNSDGTLTKHSAGNVVARALESMSVAVAATATVQAIIVESLI